MTYTIYVYTTCMPVSLKSQNSPDPLDLEVIDSFELPRGPLVSALNHWKTSAVHILLLIVEQ